MREETPLYKAIVSYHEKCAEFVRCAENLVKKYKADSAIRLHDFFDMSISGLNFTDENAPLSWKMDAFGSFRPKWNSKQSEDFNITLPYFRNHYPKAESGMKFGVLGNVIVISVAPNKDGTVCNVADADLLDKDSLDALKETASEEEREYIKQLGRYEWTPAPFLKTEAFTPSEEVRRLNNERFNFHNSRRLALKHSQTGRVVRRILSHLRPR